MFRLRCVLSPDLEIRPGKKLIRGKSWLRYLEARAILEECRKAVKQAQIKISRLYEQEKRRGFEEGLAEAKVAMAAEMARFSREMEQYLEKNEDDVSQLIVHLVKKIVLDIPQEQRVMLMIQKALLRMRERERVHITVAPENVAYVKAKISQIGREFLHANEVIVQGNPHLQGDESIVEGAGLTIEISLESHIQALQRSFSLTTGSIVGGYEGSERKVMA